MKQIVCQVTTDEITLTDHSEEAASMGAAIVKAVRAGLKHGINKEGTLTIAWALVPKQRTRRKMTDAEKQQRIIAKAQAKLAELAE